MPAVSGKPKTNGRAPSKKKSSPAPSDTPGRPTLYPAPEVRLCIGDQALTDEQAKLIMGWEEETDAVKFGRDFLLVDSLGRKVRCYHNTKNRPIVISQVRLLMRLILKGLFRFNGEAMIIGRSGLALSCQHRLAALVMACQEWEKEPEAYPAWGDRRPVIECLLVFGVDESDDVVNTLDTGKPRTLSDVIYRSEYFADLPSRERSTVSKICEYAVKTVWERSGAKADAFAAGETRSTHAEMIDFLNRHQTLLRCVKHVHAENDENKIGRQLSAGYAAGLMYLMASASSDPGAYLSTSPHDESALDWSEWDKAEEFWSMLAGQAREFKAVSRVLGNLHNSPADDESDESPDGPPSRDETMAVIVKAWRLFSGDSPITEDKLKLRFARDEYGINHLVECPLTGGIDRGKPVEGEESIPDPEEVEDAKAAIRRERAAAKKDSPSAAVNGQPSVGDEVWVDDGGGPWHGTLEKIVKASGNKPAIGMVRAAPGFAGGDTVYEVPYVDIRPGRPE